MPPKPATKTTATKAAARPGAKPATKTGAKPATKQTATSTKSGGGSKAPPKEDTPCKAPEAPPKKEEIPNHKVGVKQIANFLLDDVDSHIRGTKWWPYVIDESTIASQFLKYRDCNYVVGVEPAALEPSKIRLALLGALRYGKPFILDQSPGADLYEPLKDSMDQSIKGLLDMILDKSILKEENIQKLLKDSDPDEYSINNFYLLDGFRFIVLTSGTSKTGFSDKMMQVTVG